MAKKIVNTSPIDLEQDLIKKGNAYVIGVDEAGRGALAGDLAIGYCVLPLNKSVDWINQTFQGVTDSKKLTEKRRKELYEIIKANALACGTIHASPQHIDEYGLSQTNRDHVALAVDEAIADIEKKVKNGLSLPSPNDSRIAVLGDKGLLVAYHPFEFPYYMREFVNGELKSLSIAAASIMAKVSRDEDMMKVEPEDDIKWGFAQHKGYGTAAHIAAIYQHGIHSIHRKTFQPIPAIMKANNL